MAVPFLFLALSALLAGRAAAQLAVRLDLSKTSYVAYEPVKAKVTVINRSGRDIVLGGPAGTSWLQFHVRDDSNSLITPLGAGEKMERVLLPALGQIERVVDIGDFYPVYKYGTYRVRASVYHPEVETYFESARTLFSVADGKTIWGPVRAAVPAGYSGEGGDRHFQLLKYRGREKTELYVRISDARTGGVFATYSLGDVIFYYEPRASMDGASRLHVMYQVAPQQFAHSEIDFTGKWLKRDIYKATAESRPELMVSNHGSIGVVGGQFQDPEAQKAAAESIRSLSERPPLPGGAGAP